MINKNKKTMISCYLDNANYKTFKKIVSRKEEVISRVVGKLIFEYIGKNIHVIEDNKSKKEKINV